MKLNMKGKFKEKASSAILKIISNSRISLIFDKLLYWSNSHRKSMFFIILLFWVGILTYSITGRSSKKESIQSRLKIDSLKRKKTIPKGFQADFIEVLKIKRELDDLNQKGKIEPKDSLKIRVLFDKVKSLKIRSYEPN